MKRSAASVAVLSLVLVPLMVLIPSSSASALPITPPNLPVVNVLPSTVVGAAGRGLSMPEALIKMLASGSVDAPIWKLTKAAEAAKLAGTATSTELALIESTAAKFAPMSTRLALMTKAAGLAGPASVAVSGFYVGLGAGNTAMRLIGFKDSMVCSQQNGVLTAVAAFTNNTDCTAYTNALTKAQQDYGVAGVSTFGEYCDGEVCVKMDFAKLASGQFSVVCGHPTFGPMTNANFSKMAWFKTSSGPRWTWVTMTGGDSGADCVAPNQVRLPAYNSPYGYTAQVSEWLLGGQDAIVNDQPASGVTPSKVTTTKTSPDRTWQCTVTNTDGSQATMFSKTFVEPDAVLAVPECPQSLPGKVPDRVQVGEKTGGTITPVYDQPTTPEWKASRTNYPNCSTGLCGLELTPTATPQTTCHQDPTLCAGWFTDPSKTTKYNCTYGVYAVPLSECTTYAPTFEPSSGVTGQTLGDPETGAAGPQTTANGDPTPGRSSTGQCFPSGWAIFNPIEWVLKPVVCALQSAFVPSPTSITDFQGKTQGALNNSSVPLLKSSLGLVGAAFAQGSTQCKGPAWAVNMTFAGGSAHEVYYPLSACTGTMENLAFTVRNIGAVFVGIFALLACIRYVAAIFGYIGFTNGKADDSKVSFKGGETA